MIRNQGKIKLAIDWIELGFGVCGGLNFLTGTNDSYAKLRNCFYDHFEPVGANQPLYFPYFSFFWPIGDEFIDVRITALLLFIEAYNSGDLK